MRLSFPTAAFVVLNGFLFLGLTGQAQASEFLKSLEGTWRGSGEIRQYGANKPTERTVCKITSQYSETAGELKTNGRCGTVSGSGRINGMLQSQNGKDVTGNFIGRGGNNNLKGAIAGKQITLKGPGPKNTQQQLNMVLSGNNQLSVQLEIRGSNAADNGFSKINLKRQ